MYNENALNTNFILNNISLLKNNWSFSFDENNLDKSKLDSITNNKCKITLSKTISLGNCCTSTCTC